MNRKQKIIVSVTGILLVSLILIGLTFGYFLTQITGNSNPKSISVTTANLELTYDDGTGTLTSTNKLVPNTTVSEKTFSVENTGDSAVDSYAVILEDLKVTYATTIGDITAGTITYLNRPEDFELTITCSSSVENKTCNGYDDVMPSTNDILLTNSIEKDEIQTYSLTLTYVEAGANQSADMNKTIAAKIDIIDTKGTVDVEGTVTNYSSGDYVQVNSEPKVSYLDKDGKYKVVGLKPDNHKVSIYNTSNTTTASSSTNMIITKGTEASVSGTNITITDESRIITIDVDAKNKTYDISEEIKTSSSNTSQYKTIQETLMSDDRITKNSGTPTFTGVETAEVGMYKAPDDYGDSWYFRGKQSYNYVNFAGFTWRIVRINGDGSIRLILDGTLDKVYRKNEDGTISTTPAGTTSTFKSSPYNDNAYAGYMYGEFTGNSTSYDDAHENKVDSTIKDNIDLFYETYIESDKNNYHYEKYLADTLFCEDKTLASEYSITTSGFGINDTYYAAYERLQENSSATPTLECASGATNTYSRYTSKLDTSITTTKGVNVNNDLNYPIALLSADELILAGADFMAGNTDYYLYDAYKNKSSYDHWWTMTPYNFNQSSAGVFNSIYIVYSLFSFGVEAESGVRPVLNLSADVQIKEGLGTYQEPYELVEIN